MFGNHTKSRPDAQAITTKYAELVNRYKHFRAITRKLHNILPEHLPKKAIEKCGKKLGVMKGKTLVLGDIDDTAVLMDYCIYDYYENGSNAISQYIAHFPPAHDSDEYVVLKAMSESFYTLVQIERVIEGVGVLANDLLGSKQFLIIDISFSKTGVKGLVLATRLIPFQDFVMTSGAALPVDPETFAEISEYLSQNFVSEDGRYLYFTFQQRADLITRIIRLCLTKEKTTHIEYKDVESEAVISPLRREARVGRNDPCPLWQRHKI